MIRRGILGGTFDPIHMGHVDVARAARHALALSEVVLMPAGIPPHRKSPVASAADRLAMVRLTAAGEPGLSVSDLEIRRTGPSFTSLTLDDLSASGADLSATFFITGADAFGDIRSWRGYPGLLDRCHFVAVSRPGHPAASLRALLPDLSDRMLDAPCGVPARPAVFLVNAPTAAASSTDVRLRLAEGRSIDGLVPAAVSAYIHVHGPYRRLNTRERI